MVTLMRLLHRGATVKLTAVTCAAIYRVLLSACGDW